MIRTFVILLALIHLFSTAGFSLNVHYCGYQKSYSLFGIELGKSCTCNHQDDKHGKSCCKDEKIEVTAKKKEFVSSKIIALKKLPSFDLAPLLKFSREPLFLETETITFFIGHPPNHSPPLHILNGVFRI